MKRIFLLIAPIIMSCSFFGIGLALAGNAQKESEPPSPTSAQLREAYGKLPLSFEANHGQTDSQVKFLSRRPGFTLYLKPTEAVLVFMATPAALPEADTQRVVRMQLLGANPSTSMTGLEQLPGRVNYFIGNNPHQWRTNLPTYAKVKYEAAYPGIDLLYYGNQRQLEFDFIVAPGADPEAIRLSMEGADHLEVDTQGDLVLYAGSEQIRAAKPLVYQVVNGVRREISGSYVLTAAHQVGIQIAAYDASRPLIIDPTFIYSTYLGGSGDDLGLGVGVDAAGNAFVTGSTTSLNFPATPGAFQTTFAGGGPGGDVFVTKLNPTGSGLFFSTYLGGSGDDVASGIAVDSSGNAYVIGYTGSTNFPATAGAFQTALAGGILRDAFVTKLDGAGLLSYSTYLGGTGDDRAFAIAIDASGNAYATGATASNDFSTTVSSFQPLNPCSGDCSFVTKLNPIGSGLVYSTYLGPSGNIAQGFGIAVDTSDNAYVTGGTAAVNFPTTPGAFQTTYGGGSDTYVTKLNLTGSALVYSTYLGGSGNDNVHAITVDSSGNAFVTGLTNSLTFPTTAGAFQPGYAGVGDVFVTKLNPTGTGLVYSTYLGGSQQDDGWGIALDGSGNAYVTGLTVSSDFPTTLGAIQPVNSGGSDAFVTALNPTGTGLVYSSYLGGAGSDAGRGIAVDSLTNAYVGGVTDSLNFPTTTGAFQTTYGGGPDDAFVTKIINIVLPSTSIVKVTGGGTIDVTGGIGNFGFIVNSQSMTGPITGNLQFKNHVSGAKVDSATFTSLTVSGNTATFSGTCTNNSVPCTFTVNVTDNGEPGINDSFTISISGGQPQGGTLSKGNIQIHQ
jgi:hypothetical protein